ncbi:ABC transporter substrate-binding protein [Aureimonas fodinaquatilis]|nr:extracellular solute-binding protein [Aureimonas fodinaquatilis]
MPFTRRRFLKTAGAAAGALATPYVMRSSAFAQSNVVNVWTYANFLPQSFIDQFQRDTGVQIRIRLVDDQGAQFNLMAAEAPNPSADLVTIASHRFKQFVSSDLLAPLDTEKLIHWQNVNPVFRESDWISMDGNKWGMPILTGADALCYNTEMVSDEEADSWMIMFDPKFKGQVTYEIQGFFSSLILAMGNDGNMVEYLGNEEKAREVVNAARDMMIEHKDMVRKYVTSGPESQQMFINQEVVAAQAWSGPFAKMIMEGFPLDVNIPKEGGYGFVYNLNLANNSPNAENAYKLLDAILASPEVGTEMVRASGFASTIDGADEALSDLEKRAIAFSPRDLERLIFISSEANDLKWPLIDAAVEQVKAA